MKTAIVTLFASVAFVSAAAAADAVVYSEPSPSPAAVSAYDWSGFFIGAFGGITTGDYDFSGTDGVDSLELSVSGGGFVGGAQAGYNHQIGNTVLGIVADIAATNHEAELSANVPGFGTGEVSSQLKYVGTVRGRVGYAADRFMVYGHGGFAYGETEQTVDVTGFGTLTTENDMKTGWTVGAGAEYAVTNNVTFQTEYGYTDLGEDIIFDDGTIVLEEDVKFHSVKVGVNFRF